MKKVILVDGNNLLFRSFFATSYSGVIMKNSKGFPTNALYGFINMMNKIINEEEPKYIMVAFDKGKTFRHDKYKDYKAGRNAMPEELKLQFPKAKEVLDAMGIKHFEIDNYEADDIIGTLAKKVDEEDEFVATIVSSDKDLLQLISDEVEVKLLKQGDNIRMTKEEFIKTYQVEPIRMVDLKALMGDSSDHIPGVKGIGEKTAISLLSKYNSLDNLYEHIDEISGKTKEKLINDKESAYMSYDLATIYREVPLGFTLESLEYEGVNKLELKKYLEEFEFNSLLKKYNLLNIEEEKEKLVVDNPLIIDDIKNFSYHDNYSIYIEIRGTNYSKGDLLGVGIYDGKKAYFIAPDDMFTYKDVFENKYQKATYDLKKDIVVLNNYNIKINNTLFDTMIAAYLLDYVVKDDISFIAKTFSYDMSLYDDLYGTEKRPKEIEIDTLKKVVCEKAKFIYETEKVLKDELIKEEELQLFEEIEMPLARVLADMEIIGVKVNREYLQEVAQELSLKMEKVVKEIYALANCEFNVMSPKQLGEVLFKKMKIPYPKKVKDNKYSTSKDILDKINSLNPIVSKILDYRTLSKLYSNYAVGLEAEIREDGRIHTIFTQTLTRTGRLSSISPNLQNIPARDEYSRLIRKAFIPDENSIFLSSDYSQIELRVFAHMSNATNLIQAFVDNKDIHKKTAADIFKVNEEEVTKSMRRTAKAVNFGILYGISSFGLSEDLGIDILDAKEFMSKYLETYPGISEYMEHEKEQAHKLGYVKTIMNRKRVIEELKSKNFLIRSAGERMALNTPIQGTAADILKKAMVLLYDEFNKRQLKSKILIQVHDELIINVLKDEEEVVKKLTEEIMENVVKLKVPLKVEIETGNNWYEAK